MGKATGFKEYKREVLKRDPVEERLKNYREFEQGFTEEEAQVQGARCMDCGVPFCHGDTGCPVDNIIPEWNDLVYRGHWKEAIESLHSTNNFPEFTSRLCPAPCETACVLGIIEPAVSIKAIERSIIDTAFERGWVKPQPPESLTGKSVAVVGSGPSGLAAAQQLARLGHRVCVFEKNDRIGGLLRYGIPDFKMEKHVIDRRMEQMSAEGVIFKTGVHIGVDTSLDELIKKYDAIVLAGGSEKPRDLPIPGRELNGIYFAMDFLSRNNKVVSGDSIKDAIHAEGKNVVVIGGGDTGSDCVGTSNRHGCKSVTQLEIFPMPPKERPAHTPWPHWPAILRTSSSHQEGVERKFAISTKRFLGDNNNLRALEVVDVKFENGKFIEIENTLREIPAELVFLAMGFVHPIQEGLLQQLKDLGGEFDNRGNVKAGFGPQEGSHRTAVNKVFVAGDMRRGQSLIVWAIAEGRNAATAVHRFLQKKDIK